MIALASLPYLLPHSRRGEEDQRAAHGKEDLVRAPRDESRSGRGFWGHLVSKGHDRAAEDEPHKESRGHVGAQPSPRTPPDPTYGQTEASVLDRFQNRQEQYGGSVGPGPGDLEGLDRSLMEAARNGEGDGSGEEPQDSHQRRAGLGDGRPEGEPDADDGRPGDLPDEVRGHRLEAGEDPEPRREEQE